MKIATILLLTSLSSYNAEASFLRASKRDNIEKDDKMHSEFVERPDGFQHAIPINIDDIDDIPEEIRRIFRDRPKFPPTDGDELELEEESSFHHGGDGRDDIDDEDKMYSECDEIKYDEEQCLEAEENGTCVWNDEKGRCEDVRKMNGADLFERLDFELAKKNLDDDFPDYIPEDIKKLLKKLRERSGGDGVIRPKMEFVDYEDPEDFEFEEAGGDKTSEDGKPSKRSSTTTSSTSKKSSTTTSSKDESKCVGRYRNKEVECRASSKCVWNDSRDKCEDDRKMNEADFLEPAQQNDRGRIPDDIDEEIRKFLKRLGKVPGGDELNFELAEKSPGEICHAGVSDDDCEDILRLLKKLREAFGPKFEVMAMESLGLKQSQL